MPIDRLFDGRLRLRQGPSGHRVGTDAVLLAAAAPAHVEGIVADFGTGVGAVGLAVALRCPKAHLVLVEREAEIAALARENIGLNGLDERAEVVEADLLGKAAARRQAGLADGSMDLILTNPPFAEEGKGRASPDEKRRRAHEFPVGGLDAWLAACAGALKGRGTLLMIHRADALAAVLAALENRFGAVAILPVHPRVDQPAHRILVRAVKGSRGPLVLHPPLILHEADGRFTARAERLHRGEILIDW